MGIDKGWMAGSTAMLLLRLLEERDRYGYQMIEELRRRSDHTFDLKAGTLYPLLHGLEGGVELHSEIAPVTLVQHIFPSQPRLPLLLRLEQPRDLPELHPLLPGWLCGRGGAGMSERHGEESRI